MLKIDISKPAAKFLVRLPPKQRRQVVFKIESLREDPYPHDSKQLKGYPFFRADVGEYRIIYIVEGPVLQILVVGKRNDGDVYRRMERSV